MRPMINLPEALRLIDRALDGPGWDDSDYVWVAEGVIKDGVCLRKAVEELWILLSQHVGEVRVLLPDGTKLPCELEWLEREFPATANPELLARVEALNEGSGSTGAQGTEVNALSPEPLVSNKPAKGRYVDLSVGTLGSGTLDLSADFLPGGILTLPRTRVSARIRQLAGLPGLDQSQGAVVRALVAMVDDGPLPIKARAKRDLAPDMTDGAFQRCWSRAAELRPALARGGRPRRQETSARKPPRN
ncbi:hypothetical protein HMH01_08145 [Halovulum dunhuangense]|uniref:Uncharacterized protein n=1 Tax=Halovulum dunhuangense TaxID=1505036 RepID=A0A849L2E1_9RHOB|nr:hypothetical protein [Halovulum dunhuangense]NNU80410.1 hypothetical protein [Halovulum dunhuangense]